MEKLVIAYQQAQTIANAQRIFKHLKAHPFSLMMINTDQHKVVDQALQQIQES